jgi:hypothetical protein
VCHVVSRLLNYLEIEDNLAPRLAFNERRDSPNHPPTSSVAASLSSSPALLLATLCE